MSDAGQIAKRLREFAEGRYSSLAKFANDLGIMPQSLNGYLSGRSKPGNKLQARLRELGCDIEWLMTGKKSSSIEEQKVPLHEIPVYSHVRAGTKALVFSERPVDYITIPGKGDGTRFGLVVKGHSMKPRIEDGDVVVVSRKHESKSGDTCLIVFDDGDTCIRYVHFHDHMVTLTSSNPDYKPETFKKGEIRWCYKVVGLYRRMEK